MKVLVVEDSERLQRSLRHGLHRSGFAVDIVGDGEEGLAYARHGTYDAIILDLMLPKLDGLTVLRRLRDDGSQVHVLILSARDQVDERIQGLQLGAAYIWRTGDVRLLGNYDLVPETDTSPFLNLGFAFQDSFDDNVAPFVTTGKGFELGSLRLNPYVGFVDRPNESHQHFVSGLRLTLEEQVYLGFQHTGHDVNYYVGASSGPVSLSLWAREGSAPGVSVNFTVRQ